MIPPFWCVGWGDCTIPEGELARRGTGTQAEAHQELFLQVHGAQVQLLVCEAVELPLQRRVQPGELFPEGVVAPEVGLEGLLVFPDAGHGVTDGGQTSGVDLL